MITMDVVEIFRSVQGEGEKTGLPCVFVRLYGCPNHCHFCDTKNSWEGNQHKEIPVKDVIKTVLDLAGDRTQYVVITGGEPFMQAVELQYLTKKLVERGMCVMIETSGSVDTQEALDALEYIGENCEDRACINLSPKNKKVHDLYRISAHEIKLLVGASPEEDPVLSGDMIEVFKLRCEKNAQHTSALNIPSGMYVQPIAYPEESKTKAAIQRAVEKAEEYGCAVSFQIHKYAGLR